MRKSDCESVVRFVHSLMRISPMTSPTRTCHIMSLARTVKLIGARFNGTTPPQSAQSRRVHALSELADIATHLGARLDATADIVFVFPDVRLTVPVVY